MRILTTADTHLGLTRYSKPGTTSRTDDMAATLVRFAKTAVDLKVDAAFLSGDCFNSRRPPPSDWAAFSQAARTLSDADISWWVSSGNHDASDKVADQKTQTLAWVNLLRPRGLNVLTQPFAGAVKTLSGVPFNLVMTPYPHRRSFDALMPDAPPEQRVEEIGRRLELAIDTLIDKVQGEQSGLPTIFMGHLSVVGAALGTEITMRFGWDVAIRSGILDRVDFGALGHIHRQQKVGDKSWYAGSPEYMDFGEEGQRKGFLLVEVEKGKAPVVQVIDSQPRPMVTIDLYEQDEGWTASTLPPGAIVSLRLHPKDRLSKLDELTLMRERRGDASYVRSEVVKPDTQAADEAEVDAEMDTTEALRRWLVANRHEVEPYLTVGADLIREMGARGG